METGFTAGQLAFHGLGRHAVVGEFNGGIISSDSGGLLLREVEQRVHILKRLAGCFVDYRNPDQIESFWTWRQRTIRYTGTRKAVSSTATTAITVTGRRTSSAASTCCVHGYARPIRTVPLVLKRNWNASDTIAARAAYEQPYCARGDMENRIKEQQLALFADRTSTQDVRSNQLRLYFSSFAYVLAQTLRRLGVAGTSLAKAQCDTIRVKLFKIGAHIRLSLRRVWIAFSESYPYTELFRHLLAKLQRIPLRC
jgi:hypothetical protein